MTKNKDDFIIEEVNLNLVIQNQIVGTRWHLFKSIDCVISEDETTNHSITFLNFMNVRGGLLPRSLLLMVGSIIIMLRNLNKSKLCNVIHMVIIKFMINVIHETTKGNLQVRKLFQGFR